MGRIVDVEQFLQKYQCDPAGGRARVSFEVEDKFLEWNNRTFTVDFRNGACRLVSARAEHTVRLSVATLTTLLLGYKTAAKLERLGRLQADEETVQLIDDLLFVEIPYISDYI